MLKETVNELLHDIDTKDQAIAKASRVIELLKEDVQYSIIKIITRK